MCWRGVNHFKFLDIVFSLTDTQLFPRKIRNSDSEYMRLEQRFDENFVVSVVVESFYTWITNWYFILNFAWWLCSLTRLGTFNHGHKSRKAYKIYYEQRKNNTSQNLSDGHYPWPKIMLPPMRCLSQMNSPGKQQKLARESIIYILNYSTRNLFEYVYHPFSVSTMEIWQDVIMRKDILQLVSH